jgi:geranylgeranyl pyrophosphate synthase
MNELRETILGRIEKETGSIDFSIPESQTLPAVDDLLSRSLMKNGKKLRPYLCLCFGQMLGVPRDALERCAKIVEIVHAATLAHDDVIDEAMMRRGRRTLNATTSNSQAVLAGDLLLARSTTLCLGLQNMDLLRDLAETLEELVAGEWLQLEARGNFSVSERQLERVSLAKTGSLLRWCFLAPLRLKGASSRVVELSIELSRLIGLSFQMGDDCVDYSQASGKSFGKDYSEGLINWVTWSLISKGLEPDSNKEHGWDLKDIEAAVAHIQERATIKLQLARVCLEDVCQEAVKSGIEINQNYKSEVQDLILALEKRNF